MYNYESRIPIAIVGVLTILCAILLGTTIYFWMDAQHLRETNTGNAEVCQSKLDFYLPFTNIVTEAKKCTENPDCPGIVITPNRANSTTIPVPTLNYTNGV